jgi:hypothetical protein
VTRRLAAALAGALLLAPAARAAPEAAPVEATVAAARGRVVVGLDLSAAFEPELERRLGNGLTNVVTLLVALVPEDGGPPAAVAGRVVEVLYDVWDEAYLVTVRDARRPGASRRAVAAWPELRRLLSEARDLDLGPAELLPSGPFRVEARLELNPVSRELLQRTRELLAAPAARGRPGAGSRSVLGAMAGYLLREPEAGDDVRRFRSRPFSPGELGVP